MAGPGELAALLTTPADTGGDRLDGVSVLVGSVADQVLTKVGVGGVARTELGGQSGGDLAVGQ